MAKSGGQRSGQKPSGQPQAPQGGPVPVSQGPVPVAPKPGGGPVPVSPGQGGKTPQPIPVDPAKAGRHVIRTESRDRRRAIGAREELEELKEEGGLMLAVREWLDNSPSWMTSAAVHLLILLILGLLTLPRMNNQIVLEATPIDPEETEVEEIEQLSENYNDLDFAAEDETVIPVETEIVDDQIELSEFDEQPAPRIETHIELDISAESIPLNDTDSTEGSYTGRGFEGRGQAARKGLLEQRGGTPGSEKAVAAALKWIAAHQSPDGGWSFNHNTTSCNGKCSRPGSLHEGARTAATGLALLPFLGAGNTHKKGEYAGRVKKGLYFLTQRMQEGPNGGSLVEPDGKMYGHGIAAIALCEAYGMTQDKWLHDPAQKSIDFIGWAQDPGGGGWRYMPREAGDTSVLSWQMLALKSAHMAYLKMPPGCVNKATGFLDSVQSEGGAKYGYNTPIPGSATTAIGLLCRMYTGWDRDNPALEQGVQWLSEKGPSRYNMYYNYYATQAMIHYDHPEWWPKWNEELRDYLVASQAGGGHEEGSWYFKGGDQGVDQGGRLYCTCMATLILEVYYRHMPIYGEQASNESFAD